MSGTRRGRGKGDYYRLRRAKEAEKERAKAEREREDMREKARQGWTVGSIARFYGISAAQTRIIVGQSGSHLTNADGE